MHSTAPAFVYYYDDSAVDPGQASQSIALSDWQGGAGTPSETPVAFTGTGTATFEHGQMTHIDGVWTFEGGYTWTLSVDVADQYFTYVDSRPGGETGQNPYDWQQYAAATVVTVTLGGTTAGQATATVNWSGAPAGGNFKIEYHYTVYPPGSSVPNTYKQNGYPQNGVTGSDSNVLSGLQTGSTVKVTVIMYDLNQGTGPFGIIGSAQASGYIVP
jgi:hypothetical protein